MKIIKTSGPEYINGPVRGHCYDDFNECAFWQRQPESKCLFFGASGVKKQASEALRACDKIYGTDYNGEP